MSGNAPRFVVVDAQPHSCPYLPDQIARTPLRLPIDPLDGAVFDVLLARGDRRAGQLLYRTECPACRACEALRIPTARLVPTRSQRRVLRRNEDLRIEVREPIATPDRVALYNRHRNLRGLAIEERDLSSDEYQLHYVESCIATREIDYFAGDRLIAFSLLDVGSKAASSVYHCFEPEEGHRSVGVYSVLREVALCQEWSLDWYYLGLWVRDCPSLSYKATYFPHQRLRDGLWHEYADKDATGEPIS